LFSFAEWEKEEQIFNGVRGEGKTGYQGEGMYRESVRKSPKAISHFFEEGESEDLFFQDLKIVRG